MGRFSMIFRILFWILQLDLCFCVISSHVCLLLTYVFELVSFPFKQSLKDFYAASLFGFYINSFNIYYERVFILSTNSYLEIINTNYYCEKFETKAFQITILIPFSGLILFKFDLFCPLHCYKINLYTFSIIF